MSHLDIRSEYRSSVDEETRHLVDPLTNSDIPYPDTFSSHFIDTEEETASKFESTDSTVVEEISPDQEDPDKNNGLLSPIDHTSQHASEATETTNF